MDYFLLRGVASNGEGPGLLREPGQMGGNFMGFNGEKDEGSEEGGPGRLGLRKRGSEEGGLSQETLEMRSELLSVHLFQSLTLCIFSLNISNLRTSTSLFIVDFLGPSCDFSIEKPIHSLLGYRVCGGF